MPFSSMSTDLIKPARPAALSRCPMFPLMEPIGNGLLADRCWDRATAIALASIGSPIRVPVP